MAAPAPLVCGRTVSRVSSVLNRDVKQFGKKHLFDEQDETCWNSDQGSHQWVMLEFPQPVRVAQVQIQFQGGRRSECLEKIGDFYPQDNNSLQSFPVPHVILDKLKVTFENSTDFFGRIIIYHLRVLGEKL
ncbi:nuclear receptor 2C2-associated protein isoform X2 [Macrotis lagotis]|uniref:nuclear receptor 2C2-associated protein isoform X2 n=1 Tax=Macrotis lagotis TaxID=92651 RepID=UPI003D6886E1